jgi:hypothetical protein
MDDLTILLLINLSVAVFAVIILFLISRKDKLKESESSLGILTGKDAERFIENMKIAENNRLPDEEIKRINDNYQAIMKIAKL